MDEDRDGSRSLGFKSLCPKCYSPVQPKASDCNKCGASFWSPLIEQSEDSIEDPFLRNDSLFEDNDEKKIKALCPKCNNNVDPNDKSCKKCGERFWSPIITWE